MIVFLSLKCVKFSAYTESESQISVLTNPTNPSLCPLCLCGEDFLKPSLSGTDSVLNPY
ncbi:hypothetical protein CKA32_004157 [Geitlerinema sp. FC II]|nr:hypothetical protein CKA32_004157 [Geitlerinema sp. FC II]